jgi:hypothetical protein
MSVAVTTATARHEACVDPQIKKLAPSPQREAVAVSLFRPFKLLRRLPVVFLSELLLVGYILAAREKLSDI